MSSGSSSQREQLFSQIVRKQSFLCVGLDPVMEKLPAGVARDMDGVYQFLYAIIEATSPYCVAFKPNFAFFESFGPEGSALLKAVIQAIPEDCLVIGDAKRGDIGNTAEAYARAVFDQYGCDAITVSPYMGVESLMPFMAYPDKWTISLALTSNPGSQDFQRLILQDGGVLWEKVMRSCIQASDADHLMFVVGATHPHDFRRVREIAPDYFLLVPGFGAQKGSLEEVAQHGFNRHCGILANVSRGILYASDQSDYIEASRQVAKNYQRQMADLLSGYQIIQ